MARTAISSLAAALLVLGQPLDAKAAQLTNLTSVDAVGAYNASVNSLEQMERDLFTDDAWEGMLK